MKGKYRDLSAAIEGISRLPCVRGAEIRSKDPRCRTYTGEPRSALQPLGAKLTDEKKAPLAGAFPRKNTLFIFAFKGLVKMRDFYGVVSAYALNKRTAKHGYVANSVKIHKLAKRVKHQNISTQLTL